MTKSERTTLAEIAREANVAVSTVSKVLNGHTDVAMATRLRIERLLAEHSYRRTPAARRTAGRTGLIDLVTDEPDSLWGLEVLAGVSTVVHDLGLGLVVSTVAGGRSRPGTLLPSGSEGAVLALSALTEAQRIDLDRRAIPYVLVDGAVPGAFSIGATDFAGGCAAVEHLIRLGHRRIGLIGGPRQYARARVAGYRAALESAGLAADPLLVRDGDLGHPGGLAAAGVLLGLADPPTALFAVDDRLASGACEAVRRAGLTTPGDVSVVGFGDLPFASWMAPPLTTVRQPLREMGVTAARTLLRLVGGEQLVSSRIELATELVVRASTAPPGHAVASASAGARRAARRAG
jgi:DNA-binding LacI/PurR family transcriptional regulator